MSLFSEKQQTTILNREGRENEYQRAQQAAVEAVMIGREALETTFLQGEQLQNSENIADETEYTLDKANRLIRGLSWTGWLANKLSRDIDPPTINETSHDINTTIYLDDDQHFIIEKNVPDYMPLIQSLRNYQANLQVLKDCETDDQKNTCRLICDDMHKQVLEKIREASKIREEQNIDEDKSFVLRLQEDLSFLRQCQLVLQQVHLNYDSNTVKDKAALFNNSKHVESNSHRNNSSTTTSNDIVIIQQEQEEHLDTMNNCLQELGSLASHLNISLVQQSEIIDSLDDKSEKLHFKTNVINRRTDRFINQKSWIAPKPEFIRFAWIKHKESGKYLSVVPNNDTTLALSNILNERCIFGIWKKHRENIIGMQNKYNRRWMGQNFFGQVACSATSFNRREEWEVDGDWSDTTLLIVSAGWGSGGYMLLAKGTQQPKIGGCDVSIKNLAPRWLIGEFLI